MVRQQLYLLVLLFCKGVYSEWDVQYPESRKSIPGSCFFIPCTFSYPSNTNTAKKIVPIWFKNYDTDKKNVYHPTDTIDTAYMGRVEFLGDTSQKNCTTLIKNLQNEDAGLFNFRFEIKEVNSWMDKRGVRLEMTDKPLKPEVVTPSTILEGKSVNFLCTTPYYCPDGSVTLEWQDYATDRSFLSRSIQLDTSKVLMRENLTTTFTWQEDKKIIRCALAIGNQKTVNEVVLNVQYCPKEVSVLITSPSSNIKQGDTVTLTCHVKSSNPAVSSYTWYKNGDVFSTEQYIYFHSISTTDFGEFRCEVQNAIGKVSSETVQLTIFSAKTTVTPSSEVREGETVTLTCDTPSVRPEEIHYSWYKNNVQMKEELARSLAFHDITTADAGYYFCKIENDKGSDSSPPITLNILYAPRVPTLTSFLETQEGKLAIIHCFVDSNPPSELMLYKEGDLIATSTSPSAPNLRLSLTSTWNSIQLKIQKVILSDEGTYSCLAKNTIGNSTSSLHFIVETARVIITPAEEIEEGKAVTLTCLATRNSQTGLTYTWYKNNQWLKEDLVEKTLSIPRLSRNDAGSYHCKVQNSEGSSSSPSRMLHVLYPPGDLSLTSLVATQDGILAIVHCSVVSDPHSELFIYKKDILLASSTMVLPDKRYNVSPSTNSLKLEIQNVLVEDEGTYTCFANNTYGHATGSLEFTAETAKIIVFPSSEVLEGMAVNLTCILKSTSNEDSYLYTWYKNGALYSQGSENFIELLQVLSSNSGSYYCKVQNNENSKNSASVSLTVLYAPRHIKLKSFLDTEEGKVASIHCTVDSYPHSRMYLYLGRELVASNVNRTSFNEHHSVSLSYNELRLDIKNVKLEDEGKYTCTSTNNIGSASESVYFKVQSARILVSPSTEILEDEKVTLTCDMMKTPVEGVTYTWYKNSKWLQESGEQHLVFDKMKSSDAGHYYCKAHNSQESSVSPSVSLHVSYPPREPVMSSFWEAQNGQIGIIQCSVDSDPPSSLALYRRELLIGSSDIYKPSNGRMTIFPSWYSLKVEIRDVMLEDEAMYVCTANNSLGESTSSINFTAQTIRILVSPSAVVQEGQSLNLTCAVATSAPLKSKYIWYKNGKWYRESTAAAFQFEKVSKTDAGSYYCAVNNQHGAKNSPSVSLNILSAKTTVTPSSEVSEGETVTLTCDTPSVRPEEIHYSWYKNNVQMKEELARSLAFHDITTADAGYYFCKIENDKGSDSSPPITLNILYAPRVPTITSFLETQEGKLAIIHCVVDSNPSSELMLYKEGDLIATSTSPSAPNLRLSLTSTWNSIQLKIQKVILSDEGTYSCLAKNTIGNSTSSLHFIVETARVIITPAEEIEEGKAVTLTCLSTRNSQTGLTYTWYKNNQWLKEDLVEKTLSIPRLSRNDAGSYHCKVQNSEGSSSSPSRMLHVLYPPGDLSLTSLVATQDGILAIVHCSVVSDPHSELFIYKKDILLASSTMVLPDKRYNVSPSTNSLKLEIQNVLVEDEGTYTCFANNTYGHATGSLEFTAETAKIIVFPSSEVLEGMAVNLTCVLKSTSNEDSYLYTWYKNGALYSQGSENFIELLQVLSSNSGSYYCKVQNNENSKNSASVSLTVLYAPRHIKLKSFLDTEEGKVASIHCTVDSYPHSRMYLYLGSELVASNVNRTSFNEHHSVSLSSNELRLDIKNVKLEDEGKYTCTSTNNIGSASESVYFKVQSARILVSQSTEILEDEKVTLTCDMMKTPVEGVTYTWYKNSKWLQESGEQHLVFDKMKSSDAGHYYCKAHNSQESSVSPSVSLHVSYPPREPVMSSFWEAQNGQIGIIQCSVDSDPPSSLALYRRELLIGSSDIYKPSNGRMTIFPSWNSLKVEIRDVMLEDEAMYVCTANNSLGESTSSINFTAQTIRILVSPSAMVQEGQSLNLTCAVATSAPLKSKYIWYKNGKWYREGTAAAFQFEKVSKTDAGSYYCAVNNQHGAKNSPSVSLNILYGPQNVYIKSFLETQTGNIANVLCEADSNPPPEMFLYKDNKLLASSAGDGLTTERMHSYFSSNSLRLEIMNIRSSDGGTYIFKVNNSLGSEEVSTVLTMNGARVLMHPSTEMNEGHLVTLTCEVLDSVQTVTSYTWYKNSRWFQDGSVGSLVFNPVSTSDTGSFSCTAHTNEGFLDSPPTILRVLYPPQNISLISFFETQERRQGVIVCTVDSDPPSSISLLRGRQLISSSTPHNSSDRIKLSTSHNSLKLEIYEITEENQGLYVCQASNSLGSTNSSIYFSVQTAKIELFPSAELNEGDPVTLTCHVPRSLQENVTYTWYKNNNWLTERADASLVLPNVSASDMGSYHCLAKHWRGTSISALVGLTVLYSPRDIVTTSFLEMHEKAQGIITCSVNSVPPSIISLYKTGMLLASTALTRADQGEKSWSSSSYNYLKLEIRDIAAEDSGTYICIASNTLGRVASSIIFTIIDEELFVYKILAWGAVICIAIMVCSVAVVLCWIR
ncbi:sialoadhesin isoform X1 [Pelobates cultripes]|uniref:B-cell receptor CD22 n=1 Tax=Pelobates cultripes TaxID=61616 RepID=A0AAD1SDB9_PELCU|nr:sialoadhesin isoform X1 [Pelobates cultripes]